MASTTLLANSPLPTNVNMSLLAPINDVLTEPQAYLKKPITVKGTITAVCKKRGCWAEILAPNQQRLRIKVRDGQWVIPMSARGKQAIATGELFALELSKSQAILHLEHMAQDAGKPFSRASVTSGVTLYNLRPSALKILDN